MGLRDIWARSIGVEEAAASDWAAGTLILSRPRLRRKAGRDARDADEGEAGLNEYPPLACPITESADKAVRFMIKADDQGRRRFAAHLA
jgi:hypothetical protein